MYEYCKYNITQEQEREREREEREKNLQLEARKIISFIGFLNLLIKEKEIYKDINFISQN